MIMLILRMLRVRRRRALGVLLLAAFTLAVAVAAPAYLAAADRSIIAAETAQASNDEQSLHAVSTLDLRHGRDRVFEAGEPAVLSAPWLQTTFAIDTDVIASAPTADGRSLTYVPELVFRQDYCAHVTMVSGRCPVAVREVIVDGTLAAALHLAVGGNLPMAWARKSLVNGWYTAGPQFTLSVVGIYRATDPTDSYWGDEHYFTVAGSDRGDVGPVLTERGTLDVMPHQSDSDLSGPESNERQHVDAVLRPGVLTPALTATVRDRVAKLISSSAALPATSSIPALLDRIDTDRATLREIVPAVAVPLVGLCCVVLFLVVAYAAGDRRPEVAAVRLRGAGRLDRWLVVAGESLLPVLVAVPVGLAGGTLLAWLVALATLSGPVTVPLGVVRPALAAATVAAMVVVVLAAYRRVLAEPVGEVVRAVPARASAWRSYTLEAAVVVLAAVAVAQLHLQPGPLVGVMIGAPALVITAIAVLVGWLVPPIAARLGARSLAQSARAQRRRRRARLAVGLGALTLARRPGAQRLLAVQAIAVGLLGFLAATASGAELARSTRVSVDLGAPRVLSVTTGTPAQLVRAVRAADPSGRYAMAAITVTGATASTGAVLAVDAARLPAVASWPADAGVAVGTAAAALQPPPSPAVRIAGSFIEISVTAQIENLEGAPAPTMTAVLAPFDGSTDSIADFGPLVDGDHTYRAPTRTCADGCRLASLTVSAPAGSAELVTLNVHHLDVAEPTRSRVDLPWLDGTRWRQVPDPSAIVTPIVAATPDGLSESSMVALTTHGMTIAPLDSPFPLPALVAGGAAHPDLRGLDGDVVRLRTVGQAVALPRLGAAGVLVDIGYLDQLSTKPVSPPPPSEVWLAADAPPGIEAALAKNGVTVTGSRDEADEEAFLARQGPAIGYRFGLVAAGAAVLLAAACVSLLAGIDRRRRVAELGALRVQGLRVATARRAAMAGQLGLVALAGLTGCLAAAVAWLLAGARLPVFVDRAHIAVAPTNDPWWALLTGAAAAIGLLALAAVAVAVDLGRRVSGGNSRTRRPDRTRRPGRRDGTGDGTQGRAPGGKVPGGRVAGGKVRGSDVMGSAR